jgi:hypothetical protein
MVPEIIMCLLFVQNWVYTRNNCEMKGKFDKRVVLCPLSKEMMSPGFILKPKKPYLLCEKVPSTLMADLLRFQRQVMAHMLPLKRRPVYTRQRRPVVCNEGDCQDGICQNTEHFSAGINRSEHHSQFSSISFTFNCKAMQAGRKSTHQRTKLGGKSWVLCRTHCKSHGDCTHDPRNQVAQDLLPTKVEQKSIDKMVKS